MYWSWRNDHTTLFLSLQAYCTLHAGRTEPSLGRRRRDVGGIDKNETAMDKQKESAETTPGEEEKVRQVIEVSLENPLLLLAIIHFYKMILFSRYTKADTTCLWNNSWPQNQHLRASVWPAGNITVWYSRYSCFWYSWSPYPCQPEYTISKRIIILIAIIILLSFGQSSILTTYVFPSLITLNKTAKTLHSTLNLPNPKTYYHKLSNI